MGPLKEAPKKLGRTLGAVAGNDRTGEHWKAVYEEVSGAKDGGRTWDRSCAERGVFFCAVRVVRGLGTATGAVPCKAVYADADRGPGGIAEFHVWITYTLGVLILESF